LASLSNSEREVLELVIAGLPNKVIARTLGLGLRTVESRKQRLYLKLAANSISELVQAALAGGFEAKSTPSTRLAAADTAEAPVR
jgi:two-component system response regulator FixJ